MILDQSVTIGHEGVSEYVISIERRHSICQMISTGTVTLSPDYLADVDPYEDIIIQEQDTRVFTGYTQRQSRDKLSGEVMVDFADPAILLQDYFMAGKHRSNGETVQTWIQAFCSLAGIFPVFDTTLPITLGTGDQATEWVNMSLLSIIENLISINGYWMYSDADGNIHFSQGHYVPLTSFFSTGDNILRSERHQSITPSRNRAVVFGRDEIVGEATKELSELGDTIKTVVIASPHIYQKDTADTLAEDVVNAFSRVLDVITLEVEGDPGITLAQFAAVDDDWLGIDTNCQITTVESNMSKDGYVMNVKLSEFCPKIWGYRDNSIPDEGTLLVSYNPNNGCYRLPPAESVWVNNNFGLPEGEIGANSGIYAVEDTRFTKVNSGVFSKAGFGVAWVEHTLTDPPNSWEDTPAPTVADLTWVQILKDPNNSGIYYGLAQWQNGSSEWRGWIAKTTDSGASWTWQSLSESFQQSFTFAGSDEGWTEFDHKCEGDCVDSWTHGYNSTITHTEDGTGCLEMIGTKVSGGYDRIYGWINYPLSNIMGAIGDTFSMWVKAPNVSKNYLVRCNIVYWNGITDTANVSNLGDTWTKLTATVTHSGEAIKYLQWYIRLDCDCGLGTYYFYADDMVANLTIHNLMPIWMAIDQTDGSILWVTALNTSMGRLQLHRYNTSDLSLNRTSDIQDATVENVVNKEYIEYPATTATNKEYVYLFGRLNNPSDPDTSSPFVAGGGLQLIWSWNGGGAWQYRVTGWDADYCGAFRDQASHLYLVRNGGTKGFYKKEGAGALILKGTPPFNTYVGAFTASAISEQFAIGSRDTSSIYQTDDDGATWDNITSNLPAGSFISGLQYITEW